MDKAVKASVRSPLTHFPAGAAVEISAMYIVFIAASILPPVFRQRLIHNLGISSAQRSSLVFFARTGGNCTSSSPRIDSASAAVALPLLCALLSAGIDSIAVEAML